MDDQRRLQAALEALQYYHGDIARAIRDCDRVWEQFDPAIWREAIKRYRRQRRELAVAAIIRLLEETDGDIRKAMSIAEDRGWELEPKDWLVAYERWEDENCRK